MRNEHLEDSGAPSVFEEEMLVPVWLSSLMGWPATLCPLSFFPACFCYGLIIEDTNFGLGVLEYSWERDAVTTVYA